MNAFGDLNLHDGVLYSLVLHWENRTALAVVSTFLAPNENAKRCEIQRTGVTDVHAPHLAPWGDSCFVNDNGETEGYFWIEMQTGDRIQIAAKGFAFRVLDKSSTET